MKPPILGLTVLVAGLTASLQAHDSGHPHRPTPPTGQQAEPAIIIESAEGVNPWSHLKFNNDPDNFQFAIVTDRTGGARPGVFEDGVRKLNLLQPEFVMSVGDLIEGYSEDRDVLKAQWDEFQGFIGKLEMPFFYLPGNHDISNPVMAEVWKERFGKAYYSFVYRDVLFLCLNSMDPGLHQIGGEQAEWVKKTLAEHPNVRWTLVFLHSPLWEETYNKEGHRGWDKIDEALQGRKYTVFSGHFHTYMRRTRFDRRYITLATTGGGSGLRGPSYGEFDQVAWVTMLDNGPLVTNLLLQGIWDDGVNTPELKALVNSVSNGVLVRPQAVWVDGEKLDPKPVEVQFANPLEVPVEINFAMAPMEGVTVKPVSPLRVAADGRYTKLLQPKSVSSVDFQVSTDKIPAHQAIAAVPIGWEAKFQQGGLPPVTLREKTGIWIIPRLNLDRIGGTPQIDGKLADWKPTFFQQVIQPAELLNKRDAWKGPDDCQFRVAVAYDDMYLYGSVEVQDEQIVSLPGVAPWQQDGVEIRIDARPPEARNVPAYKDDAGIIFIAASPNEKAGEPWVIDPAKLPEGTKVSCVLTPGGYTAEFALPLAALNALAGGDWKKEGFRLNVAVDDRDGMEQTQLWWQPDWRGKNHILGSGTFRPKEK